jgi:hypothetical protein
MIGTNERRLPKAVAGRLDEHYSLLSRFVLPPAEPSAQEPLEARWRESWRAQEGNIVVRGLARLALTALLIAMHRLTRHARLYQAFRIGFLLFTLVWIGWIAGAQLSVINVFAWLRGLIHGNGLAVLLADPLLCVLLAFVVVSFVIWGRGVYCGWLWRVCPKQRAPYVPDQGPPRQGCNSPGGGRDKPQHSGQSTVLSFQEVESPGIPGRFSWVPAPLRAPASGQPPGWASQTARHGKVGTVQIGYGRSRFACCGTRRWRRGWNSYALARFGNSRIPA